MSALSTESAASGPLLARRLGLASLVVYGVGDMVGSGIYGTIGVAAASMGNAVWLAFVGSMIAAMFTGLSYASLASRYPRAGGAAFVVQRAYGFPFLAYVVGLTVTASGLTSMATSSNVFSATLAAFMDDVAWLAPTQPWMVLLAFVGVIAYLNFRGIREAMWANWLCTAIEVAGLLFVVAVGLEYWGGVDYLETPPRESGAPGLDASLIASGAVLTFFSFVGFEDMLNVAEEVKNPQRTMPYGIVIALGVVTLLYLAIAITAVSVVDYRALGDVSQGAPLQQITARAAPWLPGSVFGFITLFAVANTVLINHVMGSRMLYGMARQGLVPAALGRVHPARRTPHVAILALLAVVLVLAFLGNIAELAAATSLLLLFVFCVVNAALIVLKRRPGEPRGAFEVPALVPVLGVLTCASLIAARLHRVLTDPTESWHAPAIAGGLLVLIAVLFLAMRPKRVAAEALPELD